MITRASIGSVEDQLVRDRRLHPHVARGIMEDQAELVGRAIAAGWAAVEAADAIWRAVAPRFYRVRIDGQEFHGLPVQAVEQMRDKSVLHKDAPVERYVHVLVENLALNAVEVKLDPGTALEQQCRTILDASIAAGLTERIGS